MFEVDKCFVHLFHISEGNLREKQWRNRLLRWWKLLWLCCPAPRWWAGMWQAASSYGVEPESLNSGLPQSLGHFSVVLYSHHEHPPVLSFSLIWTIKAKTGEASFLCTQPTSCLYLPLSFFPMSCCISLFFRSPSATSNPLYSNS